MSEEWTTNDPLASAAADDSTGLAVAAGLVAAVVGGGLWAATVVFLNLEVGWVAWGIGLLVGGAMGLVTRSRSRRLAVVAAVLALVGLGAGKAIAFAGSTGAVAEEILADTDYMRGVTAWQLFEDGELAPETHAGIVAMETSGDTLSDALWLDMLKQAESRLAGSTDAEREARAERAAAGMIRSMGLVAGVRAQLTIFDALWMLLAVVTAFRMMDTPATAPVPVTVAAEPEEADAPTP